MKGLDVARDTTGHANSLRGAGIEAVGFYLRPDRCSLSMVVGIASAGMKRFSIYEKGHPEHPGYFSDQQGKTDGANAVHFAQHISMPKGVQIFFCVDYDASQEDIEGPIRDYQAAAQHVVKAAGYLASIYGSGRTCDFLVDHGYAHSGFLSMSSAWGGYHDYKPKAAIVQLRTVNIAGFEVDTDEIVDPAVCW